MTLSVLAILFNIQQPNHSSGFLAWDGRAGAPPGWKWRNSAGMGWSSSKLTHDTFALRLVWQHADSFGTLKKGAYMYFNLNDFRGHGGSIKEAHYLSQCEHGV